MMVFFRENLAVLAVPKTGTTALAMALRSRADIIFGGKRKHMNAAFFHRKVAPFLKDAYKVTPERMAVIREPLDFMRSWYKYRQRKQLAGTPKSTQGLSFEAFIEAALSDDPPACAKIGRQATFLSLARRNIVPVHHLFAYEAQPRLQSFLNERFRGNIDLKPHNVSPNIAAPVSDELRARFRADYAAEYDLYDRVIAADGHLHQLID